MSDHRGELLEARRDLLKIKFGDLPRELDEIEAVRLRAIRFELDILDYDSPHGQWLDARLRTVKVTETIVVRSCSMSEAESGFIVELV